MSTPILKISNLSKKFKNKQVLQNLNLELRENSITSILGPNGAGKSTFFKILGGLIKPDSGEVFYKNQTLKNSKLFSDIAIMHQEMNFPDHLKVHEVFTFVNNHFHNTDTYIQHLISTFGLNNIFQSFCYSLSGGEKQRLGLACVFLRNPSLVILDEPTNGIDLEYKLKFYKFLKNYIHTNNACALLSTHSINEVEQLDSYITILNSGKFVKSGFLHDLTSILKTRKIILSSLDQYFSHNSDWKKVDENKFSLLSSKPEEKISELVIKNINFYHLTVSQENIEQIFISEPQELL